MKDAEQRPHRPDGPRRAEALEVTDLALAAYLLASGYELRGLAATPDPKRLAFMLRGPAGMPRDGLVAAFWQGRAVVRLSDFLDAQRRLKALVHRGPGVDGWTRELR